MALQWVYIARLSWPPQSSLRLRAACFPPPAPMQSPDGQTEQGLAYIPNDNFCSGMVAASYRVSAGLHTAGRTGSREQFEAVLLRRTHRWTCAVC